MFLQQGTRDSDGPCCCIFCYASVCVVLLPARYKEWRNTKPSSRRRRVPTEKEIVEHVVARAKLLPQDRTRQHDDNEEQQACTTNESEKRRRCHAQRRRRLGPPRSEKLVDECDSILGAGGSSTKFCALWINSFRII